MCSIFQSMQLFVDDTAEGVPTWGWPVEAVCRPEARVLLTTAVLVLPLPLPLQITRAAITTSEAGAVYDVFEIVVEPGVELEGVSALDVQYQVHQALYKWRMARGNSSDGSQETKRRRSDE